ncbi:CPBP family intramembrane glutamic endopeptidase [Aquiflexum gelatinilyticum]|uniref:CPBP family intramembrane glutamic endopeptidase n=1 Tax=Aquiflexum gelatinilyticum TaxID=2961943 RepID=UPI00216A712A|nr:CPBP family intramembrane glutamic endopeptidase [Aquiflexum gelatinilyticum]MCS4435190.1 CPBP family intramembrane metalloprotease [Aquiflexum gelatinilyticum]
MSATLKKVLQFPIIKIIIGIVVCFALFVSIQNFVLKPFFYSLIQDKNIANPIIHCVSILVLLGSYFFLFRLYDKRKITELSLKHLPKEMFVGFLLGFLTISLSIFILYLLGYYQVISITTTNYPVKLFTTLLVAALIEDLLHRGLIVREMENWLGTNAAIVIGMVVELQHIFNPHSNLFSFFYYLIWGFSMAMMFIYTKRIWLPYFFHIGWNFAQPFYGSNLTGLDSMGNIIQSEFNGPEFLTGGAVGIEDSIFTALFLLFIGIALYYLAKKEGKIVKSKLFKR